MNYKMKILFGLLMLGGIGPLWAQSGNVGLGVRLSPDGGGFTAKVFVAPQLALEGQVNAGGIMGLEGESFHLVGLMQYHIPLPNNAWRIFFGGGFHFGVWDRPTHWVGRDRHRDQEAIFGMDAIAGIEYVFRGFPLGLSGDFKPAINFVEDVDFFPHNMMGASARWYFGR